MKFSIKDFFSKYDQIRIFLQIWSRLLKKSLMENFIFCAVKDYINEANRQLNVRSSYKKFVIDLTMTHNKLINDTIDRFKQEQLISKETAEALKIKDLKHQNFICYQKYVKSTILEDQLLVL